MIIRKKMTTAECHAAEVMARLAHEQKIRISLVPAKFAVVNNPELGMLKRSCLCSLPIARDILGNG